VGCVTALRQCATLGLVWVFVFAFFGGGFFGLFLGCGCVFAFYSLF